MDVPAPAKVSVSGKTLSTTTRSVVNKMSPSMRRDDEGACKLDKAGDLQKRPRLEPYTQQNMGNLNQKNKR